MTEMKHEDLREIAAKLNVIYSGSPVDYAFLKMLICCLSRRKSNGRKFHCPRMIKRYYLKHPS